MDIIAMHLKFINFVWEWRKRQRGNENHNLDTGFYDYQNVHSVNKIMLESTEKDFLSFRGIFTK